MVPLNAVIISCKTIENELRTAMNQMQCHYPVLWLESGLHNWPDKLRQRIQELLDTCEAYDTVLLAMGFCGNSVVGLHTHGFRLVIPRCDDCITLLLGSPKRRLGLSGTYFLTEGWLEGEMNIWKEYRLCVSKYGEKRGRRIFQTMLAHYQNLALLDTGCRGCEKTEPEVKKTADALNLQYIKLEGTLDQIKELLASNWPEERFILVPPNSNVVPAMCTLKGNVYES